MRAINRDWAVYEKYVNQLTLVDKMLIQSGESPLKLNRFRGFSICQILIICLDFGGYIYKL